MAQEAPISLFPPTVAPDTPPATEGDQPSLPSERAAETPQVEGAGAEGIEIDRLGELDPEALGILDLGSGGMGPRVWAGSARPLIEALVAGLPADIASPTLHSLAARLLLTSAPPPGGGAAPPTGPTVADALATVQKTEAGESDFLRLRAERLYALGALAGFNRLLALVPQRVEDPWLARAKVDGLLLAGKESRACGEVPSGLARYPQDLFWAKAQVYCQFLAEQSDQALLGLDLLREQAPDSDLAFFTLANGFISGTPGAVEADGLTPLNLAILRKTGGAVSPETVASATPAQLHGIAQLTGGDHAVHAAAVERLAEVGALPGERLAGAYAAFEFTDADLADALVQAEKMAAQGDAVRGRALLYRAANRENMAAAKAEILRAALLSAEADGRANAMARALTPLLGELAPSPELAWFAPLAARTLYRIGQFERAGGWMSVLRIDGLKHPESQAAYDELTPLRRLAGGTEPLSAGPLNAESAAAESPAAAEQRLLALMLSRALGQKEPLTWNQLARDEAATSRPLERLPSLLALGDAAAEGKRGESVLLAVEALGVAAPADSHPLALGYAVSALAAVGLGNEARALAIEAALAARL
ncbi:hypothetical protein [Pelagibius marinus]|uniref:hypothetical protein n=1 Tax=Pelagibius marinus TaxID=2762760 RepID=UPI001872A1B4|nr:hypothetical protein [Pelagibius marinus]